MLDKPNADTITITDEMVMRGLEFFADTKVSDIAAETSYPEFVLDLLNFAVLGEMPWVEESEEAEEAKEEPPALSVVSKN